MGGYTRIWVVFLTHPCNDYLDGLDIIGLGGLAGSRN
jgi:hypothetical protein